MPKGKSTPTTDKTTDTTPKMVTPKQLLFVEAYVNNGLNATEAARNAGYANPSHAGVMLLQNILVHETIQKRLAQVEEKHKLNGDFVRQMLYNTLTFCPGDYFTPTADGGWCIDKEGYRNLPKHVRCLIEEMILKEQTIDMPNGTRQRKATLHVKFISKTAALNTAARFTLTSKVDAQVTVQLPWGELLRKPQLAIEDKSGNGIVPTSQEGMVVRMAPDVDIEDDVEAKIREMEAKAQEQASQTELPKNRSPSTRIGDRLNGSINGTNGTH